MNKIEELLSKLPRVVNGGWLNIERSHDGADNRIEAYFSWYGHHLGRKLFKGDMLEESLTLLLDWCIENGYTE